MFGAGGKQNPNPFGGGNSFGASTKTGPSEKPSGFGSPSVFGTTSSVFGQSQLSGPASFGSQPQANMPFSSSTEAFSGGKAPAGSGGGTHSGFGGTTGLNTGFGNTVTTSSNAFASSQNPSVFGATSTPGSFTGSSSVGGFGTVGFGNVPASTTVNTSTFGGIQGTPALFGTAKGSVGFGTTSVTAAFGGTNTGSFGNLSGTGPFGAARAATPGNVAGQFGAVTNPTHSTGSGQLFSMGKTSAFGVTTSAGITSSFSSGQSVPSGTATVFHSKSTTLTSTSSSKPTTSVFGVAGRTKASPLLTESGNVFAGKTSSSQGAKQNVFGATSSSMKNPFAARSSPTSQKVDNAALFGKGAPVTTAAEGSSSLAFGGKPSAVTTAQSFTQMTTTASLFGGKTFVTSSSAAFSGKSSMGQTTTSFSGGQPSTMSAFTGKADQKLIFSQTDEAKSREPRVLFGEKPESGSSMAESTPLFGKKPEDQAGPQQHVFGKGEGPSTLFGKPATSASTAVPAPSSATGLFGKGLPSTSSETVRSSVSAKSGDDAGRRIIMRKPAGSPQQKKRPTGLFGRAIESVRGDSGKSVRADPREPAQPLRQTEETPEDTESTEQGSSPRSARRRVRRKSTIEDISSRVALVAKNVPVTINNKVALRKHFTKFGKVSKVYSNPAKASATIHFEDHDSALNAKNKGHLVRPGLPVLTLFWSSYVAKSATGSPGDTAVPESPQEVPERMPLPKPRVAAKVSGRSELDDELASMAGTQDVDFGTAAEVKVLDRPRDLTLQPLAGSVPQNAPPISKALQMAGLISRSRKERSLSPLNLPTRKAAPLDPSVVPSKVKVRESSPVPRGTSPAPAVSLQSLVGRRCTTVEEKLEVLDARDKILREASGNAGRKAGDYSKAKVIKGSCGDMCPEKERYLRQARRRLGTYEIIPESDQGRGSMLLVDHARVIKEYSRSSADQDMPLANELRPSEVLERTMVYILNNLVDQGGEGKWSEWFEFIWSRSRAIRKDITQQHLCNQTAVGLVERCVRFHVYCSERLCEEDPAIFDMKINDENLTKCLQTLKEMYHDLATKHNQTCPSEAEFRGYMVLMNLNEGDIQRESQQLREEVRSSEAVTFALKAYSAVNSNNYIRFFKMVRQATYLNACILHRYFNQMWSKALVNLVMAYSVPGHPVQMPVSELVRLLGFEDEDEAAAFCEHYGLSSADGTVVISRQMFTEPETAFPVCRAPLLIESKLTCSVGEIINGSPLPPNIIEEPSSSFDEDGRYRPDGSTLPAVEVGEPTQDESKVQVPPVGETPAVSAAPSTGDQDIAKHRHPYSNDSVKMVAHELFIEVINETCRDVGEKLVKVCHELLECASPVADAFIEEHIKILVREVSEEYLKEMKAEELEQEARRRAELSVRRECVATSVTEDLVEDVIQQMAAHVSQDELRVVEDQLRNECRDRCIVRISEELYSTTVVEQITRIAQDFFASEVEKRRRQLANAERSVNKLVMKRHFRRWKNELAGRQRLKRSMINFPAAPSMLSPSAQLCKILPDSEGLSISQNAVHLGQRAWLTLAPPNELMRSEEALIGEILRQKEEARLREDQAWEPLDMGEVVGPSLLKSHQRWLSQAYTGKARDQEEVYWKLVVGLPAGDNPRQHFLNEWVTNKLTIAQQDIPPEFHNPQVPVISLSSHSLHDLRRQPIRLNVCVRAVCGKLSKMDARTLQNERHLQGTSSVLYVVDQTLSVGQEAGFSSERERLAGLLASFPPGSAPALLIATPPSLTESCSRSLAPIYEGKVCSVHVLPLDTNILHPATAKQLCDGLSHLAQVSRPPPNIKTEYVSDYIEHGIQRFFLARVNQSAAATTNSGLLDQVPNETVSLFNAAVRHLAKVATSEKLAQVSWPPQEFCHNHPDLALGSWNSEEWLQYLSDSVLGLSLPEVDTDTAGTDWDEACQNVWQYVAAVVDDTDGSDVFLLSRVRSLLRRVRQEFEDICRWSTGVWSASPSAENIPWSRIIQICVDHKLACFDTLHPSCSLEQLMYIEVRVHYRKEDLDDFMPPDDWLDISKLVQPPELSVLETSIRKAVKRKKDEHEESLRVTPPKLPFHPKKAPTSTNGLDLNPVSTNLLVAREVAYTLRSDMARERKVMDSYDQYLEELLKEGEVPLQQDLSVQGDVSRLGTSSLICR